MILSESVIVEYKKIARSSEYYMKKGYDLSTDTIEINIKDLLPTTRIIIIAKCDYCDVKKEISYLNYNRNYNNGDKYSCSLKCSREKSKKTCIEKYGVDNVSKSNSSKNKYKQTCLEKYGVDNVSKLKTIRDKALKSNLHKYGVEYAIQSEIFKEKSKKTCLEKYGVENPMMSKDVKDTMCVNNLTKYGVEHTFQVEEFKEKSKKTCLEKYGVENSINSIEVRNKMRETLIKNYGVENPFKSEIIKNYIKDENLKKYGFKYYVETYEYKEKSKYTNLLKYNAEYHYLNDVYRESNYIIAKDKDYLKYLINGISLFNCDKEHTFEINSSNYSHRLKGNIPLCTVCNPIGDSKSIKEKMLYEYIKSIYSNEIIQSYRDGLEIDVFLPELNLGFEFNGLYWHSEKFKEKNYHLDKTNHFKEKGIRIIHIWEDDWTLREDIVKSQINNLLGNSKKIFARKCIIKLVDIKEAKQFLNNNHIQGANSSKIKLGLYFNDELVSIMTFDQSEGRLKMGDSGYNLSRFCNKINTNVVGGASKLLSYFIKVYEPSRIVSYADKDWSIGSLYYTLGFENIGGNGPDYKYIVDGKRVHKSRYKKSRLGIQGTSITEHQETKRLGIHRIYDCGKIKFEKVIYR